MRSVRLRVYIGQPGTGWRLLDASGWAWLLGAVLWAIVILGAVWADGGGF